MGSFLRQFTFGGIPSTNGGKFESLIVANNGSDFQHIESWLSGKEAHKFYHLNNVSQLRMDDIPKLLAEYRKLLPE
ncbi:hypothetical protein SCA6_000734 [Theobroma cacao]